MRVAVLLPAVLALAILAPSARAGEADCPITADAVGDDLVDLFTAPGDWSGAEWAAAGAIGGLAAVLVTRWDDDIHRASVESRDSFPYVVVRRLSWLGKWYGKSDVSALITFGAVAGGFFAAGKANDDDRLVRTAGVLTESYFVTAGITTLVKLVSGRDRPYTGRGARSWHFVGVHRRARRSFPSGHAAGAFSMATVISKRHDDWYVRLPAWTLATGFAAQRIDEGVHWTSDVLVGAALGYAVSAFLAGRHTCDDAATTNDGPLYVTFGLDF